jgi:glyoxylate/hydroxypyruvate reductase A
MMVLLFYSDVDDPRPWREALTRAIPELDFLVWPQTQRLEEIEYALVWRPPPGMLAQLPRLKAILSLGAGVDNILSDPALPRSVPLTRMIDAGLAAQMSEYALHGVLHFHRSMDQYAAQQQRGEWRQLTAVPAQERTVGVMGLGVLGADFAGKAAALGFRVLGWSRSPKELVGVTAFCGQGQLGPFLVATHILVNFLPLTPHTERILDARLFAQLPRGACLINVARGAHLVEVDLLDALASGQIAGAMLDVFANEPLPPAHPFWTHPRVIVTPHIAAQAIASLMVQQVVDSIRRMERGEAPTGVVAIERGY